MRPCAPLGMALLLGGLPFAADWGDDGPLCLEFLHSLIHFLAVEAGKFCDFACGTRCASLPHGLQYCVFCCHNDSLFVFVLYVDKCVFCRFVYGAHVLFQAPISWRTAFIAPRGLLRGKDTNKVWYSCSRASVFFILFVLCVFLCIRLIRFIR